MILSCIAVTFVFFVGYIVNTIIKPKKFPPGPNWYPLVGCSNVVHSYTKKHGSQFKGLVELSKEYSTEVLGLKMGSELLVVVYGEKNVRQVFTEKAFEGRPDNFFLRLRSLGKRLGVVVSGCRSFDRDRRVNILRMPCVEAKHVSKFKSNLDHYIFFNAELKLEIDRIVYNGLPQSITFTDGPLWRIHRQFTLTQLRNVGLGKTLMEKEIQNELLIVLDLLSKNNKAISPNVFVSQAVINVLWKYVAGEKIQGEKWKLMHELFRQRSKAFSMAGGILNQMPWCRHFIPHRSGYALITKLNKQISNLIEEVIDKHRRNEVEGHDFIYSFMEQMSQNKETFTEEQLKMVCLDLLIAGSQTTSNVLEFALLQVLRNKSIQEKIHEEIDRVIGDNMPCWADNAKLVYTAAFMLELQRYHTIVPLAGPRRVLSDTVIDGYLIPKDTTVLISVGDIHFDAELWNDPHVFKPERFIDERGMLKNAEHMYPFGLGRRRCPGDSLAKSFVFVTFVGILQQYKIECWNGILPSDEPIIGLIASPKYFEADFVARK